MLTHVLRSCTIGYIETANNKQQTKDDKAMSNYKKLPDGDWGAWITRKAVKVGSKVTITTSAGEKQKRVVASIVKSYKTGHVVSLKWDQAVADKAEERYREKCATPKISAAQKAYDEIIEGWEVVPTLRNLTQDELCEYHAIVAAKAA